MESASAPDTVETPIEYASMSGTAFSMFLPDDTNRFQALGTIVESEPSDTIDPEICPEIRPEIGATDIAKGKGVRPEGRMMMPPAAADILGDASARTVALKASRRSP